MMIQLLKVIMSSTLFLVCFMGYLKINSVRKLRTTAKKNKIINDKNQMRLYDCSLI